MFGFRARTASKKLAAGQFVTVTFCVRLSRNSRVVAPDRSGARDRGWCAAGSTGTQPLRVRRFCGPSGQTMVTPRPSLWPEDRARHPQLVFSLTERKMAVAVMACRTVYFVRL